MEIPIYLFTGFMDSGKSSLIQLTLLENNFAEGMKTLLICCEDGEVAYDEDELNRNNIDLVMIENEQDFKIETLAALDIQHMPEQVFIEYNGTWEMATLLDISLPNDWVLIQTLATVDATTFEMYLTNMRTMILEQLFLANVVLFNRCDDSTPRGKFERAVRARNTKVQVAFERFDRTMYGQYIEELPFDINQDIIDISDRDYGIWYLDVLASPKKYQGKRVRFLALAYCPPEKKSNSFVAGRFVMTCCADDITFLGYKCKVKNIAAVTHKSWICVTAKVHVEFAKEYRGKGPVLYPEEIQLSDAPIDELIYMN
jgi:uncharacterized membrane protein YcgQ (UPF0703/DUF1980 family)